LLTRLLSQYYAPDFDPKVHKTANGYVGKDVQPKTVRIELPWSIFCGHCEAHVAKGVRYNARKREIGAYHSTKIYEFSMTCHLCSGPIVIKTDPEHRDYAVVSGAKRKHESYDADDAQVINLPDDKAKKRMASDPLFKLEHASEDRETARSKDEELEKLVALRHDQFGDDYAASRLIRSGFRLRKAELQREAESNRQKGIHVPLVPEAQEDVLLALSTKFGRKKQRTATMPKRPSSIFKK
jgi:coiled-coil domain-containing protein 130